MRGAPEAFEVDMSAARIIPAYAGSTYTLMEINERKRDHPRVCGEHTSRSASLQ